MELDKDEPGKKHKTKLIRFLGRTTPIVLQNVNGPCSLLAICNVLLLKNRLNLSADASEVSQENLLSLVADQLIEQNTCDTIDFLPRLATGIDVNVKFRRIDDFEFSRECAIFDLLDIPLYHGWIVDPQDYDTANAIGAKSYNSIMGELVALETQNISTATTDDSPCSISDHQKVRTSEDELTPYQGELIRNFLKNNASQLTINGLCCLQEGLKERELCVFFHNNHFSTMFKLDGELYLLATDQGYINQPDLVWEKLTEVNGNTLFMTGSFEEFKLESHAHTETGDESGTEEEQASFIKELETFFKERCMDFKPPKFYGESLNLLKLWRIVTCLGGYRQVTARKLWRQVGESFKPPKKCTTVYWTFRGFYEKALLEYEKNADAAPGSIGKRRGRSKGEPELPGGLPSTSQACPRIRQVRDRYNAPRDSHPHLSSHRTIKEEAFQEDAAQSHCIPKVIAQLQNLKLKANQLEATCLSQREQIKILQDQLQESQTKYAEGEDLRKKLHNTILELKGNIRVFCRVRPLLPDDGAGTEANAISYPTSIESIGRGINLMQNGKIHSFTFDRVLMPDITQADVFVEISQLIQSALDGYKVCIFAYGQTGSGKTYTMMGRLGNSEQKGLIPRSLEQIFQNRQSLQTQGWKYEMQVSMLEIYNETIRDLLSIDNSTIAGEYAIKHDANGDTRVSDLTIVDVCSSKEVSFLLDQAALRRSVGKTQMNEQSSRSHFVFTLRISGVNESTGQQVRGVLNLIDLAGSERLSKSGSTGDQLKETQAINKSLSSLSDVIFALANKKDFVPFRNSKLTYLLKPCLGGDSKTLMFVNVSPDPSSMNESLCSLHFAERVNACEIRRQTNI